MMDDTLREHAWRCDCGAQGVVEAQTEEESLTRAHAAHNASNPACHAYDDSPAYWRSAPDPLADIWPWRCSQNHLLFGTGAFAWDHSRRCHRCGGRVEPIADPQIMLEAAEKSLGRRGISLTILRLAALYYRMRQLDPVFARRIAKTFVLGEASVISAVSDDRGGAT